MYGVCCIFFFMTKINYQGLVIAENKAQSDLSLSEDDEDEMPNPAIIARLKLLRNVADILKKLHARRLFTMSSSPKESRNIVKR